MDMSLVKPWQQISAGNLASIGFFRKAQCGSCHVLGKSGAGPDLADAPSSRPADWLEAHIRSSLKVAGALTGDQVKMLAVFVAERSAPAVDAWQNAPQNAVEGALVYQANDCGSCHMLNGVGDQLGPPLNGVAERHDRSWIEQHFADPPKYSPDSIMPAFQFKPGELKLITDYIMAIPK
jgi:cbb3-type cytochrome oxidase cytochrome c subunit